MSRLHSPGPGEILDRLTILALKVCYGKLAETPIDHWEAELTALVAISGGVLHVGSEQARTAYVQQLELAATNAVLWQAEDELRELRQQLGERSLSPPPMDFNTFHATRIAMNIQKLNDRRAELVTLINCNAGVNRPPDKL